MENLYFPEKKIIFTKRHKENIDIWIKKIFINEKFQYEMMDIDVLKKDELNKLIEITKECCKEILHNIINQHNNYVDISVLPCMTMASSILATKVIFSFDWGWAESAAMKIGNQIIKSWDTPGHCPIEHLKAIELDVLLSTDWKPCYDVQKKYGNIPHK